ncbi:hypothetical protein B0H21DRAFT_828763 [Amylocystis lapponica]|nr:hypothetical protein B0H21DRAFT_828763 [Amylocystis lapponica]
MRRDIYGMPGPVDRWLRANRHIAWIAPKSVLLNSTSLADAEETSDALCKIFMTCEKAPDNGTIFKDDDVFTLYIMATAASAFRDPPPLETSPLAVLDRYVGDSNDLGAPDWAAWSPERAQWLRHSRDDIAVLMVSLARRRINIAFAPALVAWARTVSRPVRVQTMGIHPWAAPQLDCPMEVADGMLLAGWLFSAASRGIDGTRDPLLVQGMQRQTGVCAYSPRTQGTRRPPLEPATRDSLSNVRSSVRTTLSAALVASASVVTDSTSTLQVAGGEPSAMQSGEATSNFVAAESLGELPRVPRATFEHPIFEDGAELTVDREMSPMDVQVDDGTGSRDSAQEPRDTSVSYDGHPDGIPSLAQTISSEASDAEVAENRGLAHERAVSGNGYEPIADDNWEEEEEESDHEVVEGDLITNLADHSAETVREDLNLDGSEDPTPALDKVSATPETLREHILSLPLADCFTDDENSPDPFRQPARVVRQLPTAQDVHPNPAVYILYLLVTWLHTVFHLPFRACNVILIATSLMFQAAGVHLEAPLYTTLPSVMARMEAEPVFQVLPVCPKCLEVYPAVTPATLSTCSRCGEKLFQTDPTPAEHRRGRTSRAEPKPRLRFATKPLEEDLVALLAVPGMEDLVDAWRTKDRSPGLVKTHFYHIWIQLKMLRKTKELRRMHAILADLHMPATLGRLPALVGEPAGGSLTADQWLVFATVVAPLAIPQIWQDYVAGDPDSVLARRLASVAKTVSEKHVKAAAARKLAAARQKKGSPATGAGVTPAQNPMRRSRRTIMKTKCALAMEGQENDDDELPDAGAMEIDDAETYQPASTDLFSDDDGESSADEGDDSGRRRKRRRRDDDDSHLPSNLHPRDPANFLKLSRALRLLLAERITPSQITEAETLLREYCAELIELYGPSVIRPNHHYATHVGQFVRDYGPLHEFWTFLFERMNKVLKSYKTSNHAGGELEVSFFREFMRTVQTSRLVAQGFSTPAGSPLHDTVKAMYRASADDRGTVQSLARNLDVAQKDEGIKFKLSTRSEKTIIPQDLYFTLLAHLQLRSPDLGLRSYIAPATPDHPTVLNLNATFFDYIVINGHRYLSSSRTTNTADSLLCVRRPPGATHPWIGELTHIFVLQQPGIEVRRYGAMKWLKPVELDVTEMSWSPFKQHGVHIWAINTYQNENDDGPDSIIELDSIHSPVIRHTAIITGIKHWATVILDRSGSDFV